jgi:hypothetical protein
MVTDAFGLLLQEVGKLLQIPKLEPDAHNSCLINFPGPISIQMEIDRSGNSLILGCDVGTLPPGRYRELVFREALRSNGLPLPHFGEFSYSKPADKLMLMEQIPMQDINGDKIISVLNPLLEKAKYWKETISRGEVPSIATTSSPSKGGAGMFGLK